MEAEIGSKSRCKCSAQIIWSETDRGLIVLSETQSYRLKTDGRSERAGSVLVNHADVCRVIRQMKAVPV